LFNPPFYLLLIAFARLGDKCTVQTWAKVVVAEGILSTEVEKLCIQRPRCVSILWAWRRGLAGGGNTSSGFTFVYRYNLASQSRVRRVHLEGQWDMSVAGGRMLKVGCGVAEEVPCSRLVVILKPHPGLACVASRLLATL
jgi:hypothetical protein